jgi:hypothetical protein
MEWKWWFRHRLLKPWLLWHEIYWGFMHRTFKRFNKVELRNLKPGYYDVDLRLLHASFQLLKDFVEREKPFDSINWDHDETHQKVASEIKALYHWWTVEYPARADLVDQLKDDERPHGLENWSTEPGGGAVYGGKESRLDEMMYPKYHATLRLQWDREEEWIREEEENLCRLAKIRRFLWT